MKCIYFAIPLIASLAVGAVAQQIPDAKYILPGMTDYWQNAAKDALLARGYSLQCADQFSQLQSRLNGPTPGPDDNYYTGD